MGLKSRLAFWCYTPAASSSSTGSSTPRNYSDVIEALSFTQLAPGGCGSLDVRIKLDDARLPRPELAMFSRVAVMDASLGGPTGGTSRCVWHGEISDPEYGMSAGEGEYIHLMALGLGATMRDDPGVFSYVNKTPLQIIQDQMTNGNRPHYLVIDSDQSAVFPNNPILSLSPSYPGYTMEDVIQDVCDLSASASSTPPIDYTWGVWPHPTNVDGNGFPTAQLRIHQRDATTISYVASIAARDLVGYRITPSAERAYNVVALAYYDQTVSPVSGTVTYTDPRLAANGSQGSAPFRRRKYYRDLTGTNTANKATCQGIANTYGTEYSSGTNKVELTLQSVRDATGHPIPIWQIRADANIYVPELAVRGTQLVTAPTPGVNVFYIKEMRYVEDASGNQQVILQCDSFLDRAELQLARLQLQSDELSRVGQKSTGPVQAPGAPVYSVTGFTQQASGAGQIVGAWENYPGSIQLAQAPTQVILDAVKTSTNISASSQGVSNIDATGFTFFAISAAAGKTELYQHYHTVGNCILSLDHAGGTLDHHCDTCELEARRRHGCNENAWRCVQCQEHATRRTLTLADDIEVRHLGHDDHHDQENYGVCIRCPGGHSEHFNTNLTADDEVPNAEGNSEFRAEQARLIRQMLAHPHVAGRMVPAPAHP